MAADLDHLEETAKEVEYLRPDRAREIRAAIAELRELRETAAKRRASDDEFIYDARADVKIMAARIKELGALVEEKDAQLYELRARPVSCSACNEKAKRIEVLEEECRAARALDATDSACIVTASGSDEPPEYAPSPEWVAADERLNAARLATDENGGLGA